MKRKITAICTGILTTLLLAGCGSNSNTCCDLENKIVLNKTDKETKVEPVIELKSTDPIQPKAPIAIAHVNGERDVVRIDTCTSAVIDANSSFDPDASGEKELSYSWTDIHDREISTDISFHKKYNKKGIEEFTLKVTDEQNLTSYDRVCVLIGIDENCIPLVAKVDGKLDVASNENVNLKARAVCNRDQDIKFEWTENGRVLSNEAILEYRFDIGTHTLTLTVEDLTGKTATTKVVVNVKK